MSRLNFQQLNIETKSFYCTVKSKFGYHYHTPYIIYKPQATSHMATALSVQHPFLGFCFYFDNLLSFKQPELENMESDSLYFC